MSIEIHFTTPSKRNQILVDQALTIKKEFLVGVVNPTTSESLKSAAMAAKAKLITPVIFGPKKHILALAKELKLDVASYKFVNVEGDVAAAKAAVAEAAAGKLNALMKGDIHTDKLMSVVVARESGLRMGRRISHCLVMDVPSYSKLMIFTDVAINIAPDLMTKVDIVQNAIEFAHALGIEKPNVALLSAVETILENIQATVDAAVLCKMAERGQITGAVLDGPLSIDLAVSKEAQRLKKFASVLPGLPDVFVVPDLNSGNISTKILDYLGGSQSAGIVVGAKVPVILMRRSSPAVEYLVSCALAKSYAYYTQR